MMDVINRHRHPQPSSLSLRCRWGVSHHMQGKEVRTSGESSSVCASMLLSCFMRCRVLGWELYVSCVLISPTATLPFCKCSSTNMYEQTHCAHHSWLMASHLVTSCLVRPWLSLAMVPKWDTAHGGWGTTWSLCCCALPFLLFVIFNLPRWKLDTSVNLSHVCWEVVRIVNKLCPRRGLEGFSAKGFCAHQHFASLAVACPPKASKNRCHHSPVQLFL